MAEKIEAQIQALTQKVLGERSTLDGQIAGQGSERSIFRLKCGDKFIIGVHNPVAEENQAFVSFTNHFSSFNLPVPRILGFDAALGIYLEEYLGETTLMSLAEKAGVEPTQREEKLAQYYEQVVDLLPKFQVEAGAGIDYSLVYPKRATPTAWLSDDLNYFRDSFLIPSGIEFDASRLSSEFQQLVSFLAQADSRHFMYRDLQARNIMVMDNRVHFIDYERGFKGPLQYDLASLLYQSRASLSEAFRVRIISRYLTSINKYLTIDRSDFMRFFPGFVLHRRLQSLGAYGKLGLSQGKELFIRNIPYAVNDLKSIVERAQCEFELVELVRIAQAASQRWS